MKVNIMINIWRNYEKCNVRTSSESYISLFFLSKIKFILSKIVEITSNLNLKELIFTEMCHLLRELAMRV